MYSTARTPPPNSTDRTYDDVYAQLLRTPYSFDVSLTATRDWDHLRMLALTRTFVDELERLAVRAGNTTGRAHYVARLASKAPQVRAARLFVGLVGGRIEKHMIGAAWARCGQRSALSRGEFNQNFEMPRFLRGAMRTTRFILIDGKKVTLRYD